MPIGKGLWPAFWLVGQNMTSVGPDDVGEIDVMEMLGDRPAQVEQHAHGPGLDFGGPITLPPGLSVADWHTYAVDWTPEQINWQVDGRITQSLTKDQVGDAGLGVPPPFLYPAQPRRGRQFGPGLRTEPRLFRPQCWWTMFGCTRPTTRAPTIHDASPRGNDQMIPSSASAGDVTRAGSAPQAQSPAFDGRAHPRVTSPAPRHIWSDIIAHDPEALPEHAPAWLDAMCALGAYSDASRLYEFRDGRRFVLPLARRRGVVGVGGWSTSYPAAWGIGGLVGDGVDQEVVATVLADLRHLPDARIWIRPNPLHATMWPADATCGGATVTAIPRRAHVLDLSGDLDAVLGRVRASNRQHIRQGRKRVTRVEIDHTGHLLPLHYELYMASVQRWAEHQHEPGKLAAWRARRRDSLHKLQTIARHLGQAMVVQIAFVGERPAASNITLFGRTAHDIRAAVDAPLAGPSRAGTLLQWNAIEMAHERGCATLHLGESGESAGLSSFKESFGAVAVRYSELRIERWPFTRADRALRGAAKTVLRFRDT